MGDLGIRESSGQSAADARLRVRLLGVSKTFGSVRALVNVSAEFPGGEVTVVEGPNGSGKSTLLSLLGTLVRPSSGSVDFGSLGADRAHVRARLGWLGHDALVYGDLSGRENLVLAARLRGADPHAVVADAERRFGAGAFMDRPTRTYSRGQRQRIGLARALVGAPDLLLLDEPTTGLDAAGTELLMTVISEEAARGAIVVVVTHERDFEPTARRVRLERGRLAPS